MLKSFAKQGVTIMLSSMIIWIFMNFFIDSQANVNKPKIEYIYLDTMYIVARHSSERENKMPPLCDDCFRVR